MDLDFKFHISILSNAPLKLERMIKEIPQIELKEEEI